MTNERGNKIWGLYQIKGTKTDLLPVPLHKQCLAIIDKYANQRTTGLVFRTISNQKFNYYIKEICKMAGLNTPVTITSFRGKQKISVTKPQHEVITSHIARATFVTIAIKRGMPAELIMKITGHTKIETMRKYLKLASFDLADACQKYLED